MKKLFTLFALCIFAVMQTFAVVPEDGKIYKIVCPSRGDLKIAEDIIEHTVYCPADLGAKGYAQLWRLVQDGDFWLIQNVYSGRYLQHQNIITYSYTTATTAAQFKIVEHTSLASNGYPGYYKIMNGVSTLGLHCDAGSSLVPYMMDTDSPGGSSWKIELVSISEEEIAQAQAEYNAFASATDNKEEIISAYSAFFDDELCMTLKSEYASMSDEELTAAMGTAIPVALVDAAIKVKNDSWAAREKEFRVHSYEAYSDPDVWGSKLLTKKYTWQNNPTGIYANTADVVYVFVGSDVPEGATLELDAVTDNGSRGSRTTLNKGLNIVPISRSYQTLFVIYTADTSGDKVISDFADIEIRIEGGVLNGYWDIERHDDADWVDISQNLATHPYIIIKGENFIFNMVREYMIKAGYCRDKITDAIAWWDKMAVWQWGIMGLEDVRPSRFNNKLCARTLPTGYQSATHYYTQYLASYISNLLPYEQMMNNADNAWGPAHENGHVQQEAITPINCSEVSNNLFSNLVLYKLGRWTSRGESVSKSASEYEAGLSWPSRSNSLSLRMYWQLYLYYHVAGNDTLFYPKLFKLLREDPIVKVGSSDKSYINKGSDDLLHFAEKCCEASGENMTAFFESWGFFVPMKEQHYGDYADYYLTSTQEMIDATKAKMAQYPKVAGGIEFIEDRIDYLPRLDGIEGERLYNAAGVTREAAGDLGSYKSFMSDSFNNVARGYSYKRQSTISNFEIKHEGASGAVGFRVYDATGKLVTFSNKYKFTIPASAAQGAIKIVAVQANGVEVELPSSAVAGNEEEQLDALKFSLALAEIHIKNIAESHKQTGLYYPELAQSLKEIYEAALEAKNNASQEVHTYGEWSVMLDDEVARIISDKYAYIPIKARNLYKLTNANRRDYVLSFSENNLYGSNTASGDDILWEFIPAGTENCYYIKSKTGYYVSSISEGNIVIAASTEQAGAVMFKAERYSNGAFILSHIDNPDLAIHFNFSDGKKVVGGAASVQASRWLFTVEEDLASVYESEHLPKLIVEVEELLSQICVDGSTADNILLKEGVTPLVDNFNDFLVELITAKDEAKENIDTAYDLYSYINELEGALANLKGKYVVLPIISTEDEVVWYYIRNVESGMYCSVDLTTKSGVNKRAVKLEDITGQETEDRFRWALYATDSEDSYIIVNAAEGNPVYSISRMSLKVDGSEEGEPQQVQIGTNGFTINTAYGYWTSTGGNYVKTGATASCWCFEKIEETSTSIDSIDGDACVVKGIYDIYGRKLDEITAPGIYIVNGKKVVVE